MGIIVGRRGHQVQVVDAVGFGFAQTLSTIFRSADETYHVAHLSQKVVGQESAKLFGPFPVLGMDHVGVEFVEFSGDLQFPGSMPAAWRYRVWEPSMSLWTHMGRTSSRASCWSS